VRTAVEEERARLARDSVRKDSVARAEQEKRRAAGLPPIDSAAIRRAADSVAAQRDSIDRARRLAAQRQAQQRPGARSAPSARLDTTPPPKPARPVPTTEIFVTLDSALEAGKGYRLQAGALRALVGRPRPAERAFSTPKAKVDTTARDSAAAAARRPPGAAPAAPPADARPAPPTPAPARSPSPARADSVVRPVPADTTKKKPPADTR
jgi:hypothetical protein